MRKTLCSMGCVLILSCTPVGSAFAGPYENGVDGVTIEDQSGGGGGPILESTINNGIRNSTFRNNASTIYGGAIYVGGTLSGGVWNSFFEGNNSGQGGGAFISGFTGGIHGSTFRSNSARNGGGIYASDMTGGIYSSEFSGNRATSGNGGAIVAATGVTGGIHTSQFLNNAATGNGGAIYSPSFNGPIINSTFSGNTASSGGALFIRTLRGSIENSVFSGNTATGNGGAITADGMDEGESISNSVFKDNSAGNVGGAIFNSYMDNVIINGGSFLNNTAGVAGGAIFFSTEQTRFSGDVVMDLTLTAESGQKLVFSGNSDGSGTNSLYFGRYNGQDSQTAASILVSGMGSVELYDPIRVDMTTLGIVDSPGYTFSFTRDTSLGNGIFVWGGQNRISTSDGRALFAFDSGRTTLLSNFSLMAQAATDMRVTMGDQHIFSLDLTDRDRNLAILDYSGGSGGLLAWTPGTTVSVARSLLQYEGRYLLVDGYDHSGLNPDEITFVNNSTTRFDLDDSIDGQLWLVVRHNPDGLPGDGDGDGGDGGNGNGGGGDGGSGGGGDGGGGGSGGGDGGGSGGGDGGSGGGDGGSGGGDGGSGGGDGGSSGGDGGSSGGDGGSGGGDGGSGGGDGGSGGGDGGSGGGDGGSGGGDGGSGGSDGGSSGDGGTSDGGGNTSTVPSRYRPNVRRALRSLDQLIRHTDYGLNMSDETFQAFRDDIDTTPPEAGVTMGLITMQIHSGMVDQALRGAFSVPAGRYRATAALDGLQAMYRPLSVPSKDTLRPRFDPSSGPGLFDLDVSPPTPAMFTDWTPASDATRQWLTPSGRTAKLLSLDASGQSGRGLENGLRFWSGYMGNFASADTHSGYMGYDVTTNGFLMGVTGTFARAVSLGGYWGYSHTRVDFDRLRAKSTADGWHFGLYGRYSVTEALSVTVDGAYSSFDTDVERKTAGYASRADFDQQVYSLGLAAAYEFTPWRMGRLTPFVNARHTWARQDSFTEHGGPLSAKVSKANTKSFVTGAGVAVAHDIQVADRAALTPYLELAWKHEYGDRYVKTKGNTFLEPLVTTEAVIPFNTYSLPRDRDIFQGGVGVQLMVVGNDWLKLGMNAAYSLEVSDHYTGHGVFAGFELRF